VVAEELISAHLDEGWPQMSQRPQTRTGLGAGWERSGRYPSQPKTIGNRCYGRQQKLAEARDRATITST